MLYIYIYIYISFIKLYILPVYQYVSNIKSVKLPNELLIIIVMSAFHSQPEIFYYLRDSYAQKIRITGYKQVGYVIGKQ